MSKKEKLDVVKAEAKAEKAKQILCEEMENAVSLSVRLSVDAHTGKTWYDAKG